MSGGRVLRRPQNGWDRKPNHALPDLIAFVLMMFGGALFFNWASACIDAIVG